MMMKCQKCGFENQMGVIFCRSCGEKLDTSALSPENLDTGIAKSKKKNSWIGFTVYIVVMVLIIVLIYMFFAVPGSKAYTESTADYKPNLAMLESKGNPATQQNVVFITPEEMTAFFNQEVLKKDDPTVKNVMFRIDGSDLKLFVYAKMAGIGTVTEFTGKIAKGDDSNPVKFDIDSISIGYFPLSFMKDTIAKRFELLAQKSEVRETFKNAEKVELTDGKLVFTFKPLPPPPKEKPKKKQAVPKRTMENNADDPFHKQLSTMNPGTKHSSTSEKKKSKKKK